MKTRNILLAAFFVCSICSFLYVNYDSYLNRNQELDINKTEITVEEEVISNSSIMPDVEILHKVGTLVKRLLPISE